MHFTPASPASLAAFVGILMFVMGALLLGIHVAEKRAGLPPWRLAAQVGTAGAVALLVFSALVVSGFLEAAPVPRVMVVLVACNVAAVALALSPVGASLASLPVAWLLGFQGFRLPLELVLHAWVQQGVVPETMTWTGANLDILSGVVALLGAAMARWRGVVWAANVVGMVLLANVARVAVMSAPLPFAWEGVEPRLLLPFHMPYALIVPVCVSGALCGHVALCRALLGKARAAAA